MRNFIRLATILAASAALASCGGNHAAANNSAATPPPANAAAPSNATSGNAAAPTGNAAAAAPNGRRPTLTVNNRSSTPIVHFYIGPTTSDEWGNDLFTRGDPLAAGASTEIEFDHNEDVCVWDVKVVVLGGAEHELRNINLCTTHEIDYSE